MLLILNSLLSKIQNIHAVTVTATAIKVYIV